MTPRRAQLHDVPRIVAMGQQFYAMSPHQPLGEYDGEAVARMVRFLIQNPAVGLVLTNEAGVIGGMLAPVYFSPGVMMMEESFWWAAGGGQSLRATFEAEAAQMGAAFVMVSTLENERIGAIDRVMKRNGYLPIERRYLKEITMPHDRSA
jgi:hypothetical protein